MVGKERDLMDPLLLIRLHLELEGVGIDDDGSLFRIPGSSPDTLHRVYVTRHDQGDSVFFQRDVPKAVRKKLLALPIRDFFEQPERVKSILMEDRPCEEIHIGKSYILTAPVPPSRFPDVIPLSQVSQEVVRRYDAALVPEQKEVFGILVVGEIVSTCESSRENERAGEAWVRTHEAFRRRGFARQVTAAWGNWLLAQGKTPFYSHRWENFASQAVAQSLGMVQYVADAGYA
jgi:hypothetical protein